jgi:hypothetical protein
LTFQAHLSIRTDGAVIHLSVAVIVDAIAEVVITGGDTLATIARLLVGIHCPNDTVAHVGTCPVLGTGRLGVFYLRAAVVRTAAAAPRLTEHAGGR